MRPGYSIFILSLIALAVVIAGCSGINQQSTPTPTPAPTVTPSPTPGPVTFGMIHSTQVRIEDFKIVKGAGQTGNYTMTLQNIGSTEARNVSVYLNAKDLNTVRLQQEGLYPLNAPIPARSNRTITIPTDLYDYGITSVILDVRIYWGDNDEFWNGENYSKVLPWAPQPVGI
jgi:hypothetical protein